MKKTCLFLLCAAVLMINAVDVLFAQTSNLTGYFVVINGQQTGPYDTNGLKQLVSQNRLHKDSLVWKEGMNNWVAAGTINELSPLLTSAPPPSLTSSQTPPPVPNQDQIQSSPVYPIDDNYQNFSGGLRFGTWALNMAIPGLGSFVLMKDKKGGGINMGLGLSSYACLVLGGIASFAVSQTMGNNKWEPGEGLLTIGGIFVFAAGGGLYIAYQIYNIIRIATYTKPRPAAALFNPEAWQLDIVPGKEGIERVSIAYTHKF
ncbi:MAG: DUF4339 domain-containing protein [Treponema sp.]|nr:DUF4339 domain-containing protein [Treponema sp.]